MKVDKTEQELLNEGFLPVDRIERGVWDGTEPRKLKDLLEKAFSSIEENQSLREIQILETHKEVIFFAR